MYNSKRCRHVCRHISVALDMRTLLDMKNISSRTNGQVAARQVTRLIIKRLWLHASLNYLLLLSMFVHNMHLIVTLLFIHIVMFIFAIWYYNDHDLVIRNGYNMWHMPVIIITVFINKGSGFIGRHS